jgi:rhodanese-related sulfurtransferase
MNSAENTMKKFLLSFLVPLIMLPGCSSEKTREATQKPSMLVINVLDKEYYDDAHIKGSINVPMMELQEYLETEKVKDDTPIVVYCSNYACGASSASAQELKKKYKNVWAYEGGMAEWFQLNNLSDGQKADDSSDYPVEGKQSKRYLRENNPKLEVTEDAPVITAQELKKMMQEHSLLNKVLAA